MPSPNVARTLETGSILGILVVALAATGLLLSPTLSQQLPSLRYVQAAWNFTLYVAHLACAALLVAFTAWHLVPLGHSFRRKRSIPLALQVASYSLLALILVEIVTGIVLYLRVYDVLDKRTAVLVHLGTTFAILIPFLYHASRGLRVWRDRRAARLAALVAADARGKGEQAQAAQDKVTRRMFLRLAAYAGAGVALAAAFGRFTAGQVAAWRLNFVGDTPPLDKTTYRLRVTGLVGTPRDFTFEDLQRFPTETTRFTHRCVEGWTYTDDWTGTRLSHVLEAAGGATPAARQLIFKSPEVSKQRHRRGVQYTTNFPATDLDDVWLIWKVGGADLPPEHGAPVRLMSPRKWGYKACKWLTEIEATADAEYRGYWEGLGYHNDGDYPGPIFA